MNKRWLTIITLALVGIVWITVLAVHFSKQAVAEQFEEEQSNERKMPLECPTINLVYTWVNGSDPEHIKARVAKAGSDRWASPGNNRFRDLGGLFYSLRSAEKYAPWLGKIFIVTAGQVPGFLNTSHPKIELIFHTQIFDHPDKDLPTFNSNAIEGSFHNLPERVGPCFIYLNDDMFFGNKVTPSDFCDERGQILFTSSWTAPPPRDKLSNLWHRSILHSNEALDALWGPAVRKYASHGPYFFSLPVLKHMYSMLQGLFNNSVKHPFRHEHDVALPFLYNQWAHHYFRTTTAKATINMYMKITNDWRRAKHDFDRIADRRPKTVCMNDSLDEDHPDPRALKYMHEFFQKLFPEPSSYEKKST